MWIQILTTLIFGFLVAASETVNNNRTEMSNRYFFGNPGGTDGCISKARQQGRCVPLRSCPFLKEIIDQVPPMYVLSAVSEYICGFVNSGVQVCCPNGNNAVPSNPNWPQQPPSRQKPRPTTVPPETRRRPTKEPISDRQPTSNPIWWPQPAATNRPPGTNWPPATNRPPSARPPKVSEQQNSAITNHRNRRLLPNDCGIEISNKVLGGREASLDEYPWMALLRLNINNRRMVFSCGGALISPRYVLTAAHCIRNPRLPSTSVIDQVRLGEHDQDEDLDCRGSECSEKPDDVEIEERIVHENYNPRDPSSRNDIALLRLKRPARITRFVKPICLPLDDLSNKDFDGQDMWTAGWGKTTNGANSNSAVKLKVLLPIVPLKVCAPIYRNDNVEITDKQICAGGKANEDTCQGDSGGPLMRQDVVGSTVRWHVQGIVSFGPETCGKVNNPGIYTKVSKYLDWILDNMRD